MKTPLIPLIEPRRDVTMEMRPGGTVSGLTARQPIPNEEQERQQRDDMEDSAAPSGAGDDEQVTHAVPQGRAPGAKKPSTPLSAPGVATGSVTSQEADD